MTFKEKVSSILGFSQEIPFNMIFDLANFKKGQKVICGKKFEKSCKNGHFLGIFVNFKKTIATIWMIQIDPNFFYRFPFDNTFGLDT